MTISDHLDMLGVELRATWVQTRKANGDEVQKRVESTTRQWRSGKFMQLSLRSWSLNSYCLSKVWFKTHCIDLRQQDVNKILSSVKSWLYADQFLKPEEIVMFRPSSFGGPWDPSCQAQSLSCTDKNIPGNSLSSKIPEKLAPLLPVQIVCS